MKRIIWASVAAVIGSCLAASAWAQGPAPLDRQGYVLNVHSGQRADHFYVTPNMGQPGGWYGCETTNPACAGLAAQFNEAFSNHQQIVFNVIPDAPNVPCSIYVCTGATAGALPVGDVAYATYPLD